MKWTVLPLAALLFGSAIGEAQVALDANGAVLRGLDTVTGRVSEFDVRTGETLDFGRLSISLEVCRYLPESLATESYAFVRIRDTNSAEIVFDAWMISSAPALSAMDHPRYDVWLIRCKTEDVDSANG